MFAGFMFLLWLVLIVIVRFYLVVFDCWLSFGCYLWVCRVVYCF